MNDSIGNYSLIFNLLSTHWKIEQLCSIRELPLIFHSMRIYVIRTRLLPWMFVGKAQIWYLSRCCWFLETVGAHCHFPSGYLYVVGRMSTKETDTAIVVASQVFKMLYMGKRWLMCKFLVIVMQNAKLGPESLFE